MITLWFTCSKKWCQIDLLYRKYTIAVPQCFVLALQPLTHWKDRHDEICTVPERLLSKAEMSVKILRGQGFRNGIITFVKAAVEKPIHNLTQMGWEIWRTCVKQQAAWSVALHVTFYCLKLCIIVQLRLDIVIILLCKLILELFKCSSRLSLLSVMLSGLYVGISTGKVQKKSHPCCHL